MFSATPKYLFIGIYFITSIQLFCRVYNASEVVIDEEFHLRQGRSYCSGRFDEWDSKITTFPGLYLVSAAFLLPLKACSTFALRLTSLFASVVNVWLIHEIRKMVVQKNRVDTFKLAFEAFVISILPPMYLFAHLYYTDILSITTVLGMILYNLKHKHNVAAIFGFASVMMRQTNIVWVGMAMGCTVFDKLISQTLPFVKKEDKRQITSYTFGDILSVIGFYLKRVYLIPKQIRLLSVYLIGYILVILLFAGFVYVNGSIVVGDKSAHEAALHLPQILYFTLFSIIFAPSIAMSHLGSAMGTLRRRWYFVPPVALLFAFIVHQNTIVHPYLLADNRHYMFYVWNKFYGKYEWAKYSVIPIYILSSTILANSISNRSAGFKLMFCVCTIAAIALQKLIELRYFLIPFLLLRLNANTIKLKWVFFEFFVYLCINGAVFYLFTTKEIYWKDYNYVQRLIW